MDSGDVTSDYSCGRCGWVGDPEMCDLIALSDKGYEGDCELRCPYCESDRVGEITADDFKEGNALFGRTWRGKKV
jgi:hypothetical protein